MEPAKKKILVVEDDAEMRFLVTSILNHRGFDVTAVETGTEAMSRMRQAFFDLVVLDVLLPDRDGLSLCDQIKRQSAMADLPVVFLSSVTSEPVVQQGLKLGAADFFVKPPSPVEFVGRIHELLARASAAAAPGDVFQRPIFA